MHTEVMLPLMDVPVAQDQVAALSIDWYFDPAIYQQELSRLFGAGLQYVGHELMVPAVGDFKTLERFNHAQMLVRQADGRINLVSNICRHRQALMLEGQGALPNQRISCPLHRWAYDTDGHLLIAPQFPQNPCLHLPSTHLFNWRGLLFQGDATEAALMDDLPLAHYFDFSGYALDRVESVDYPFNWKTFIEVYLEDYHVGVIHPGLKKFVSCQNLEWAYGARWSLQTVGLNPQWGHSRSEAYQLWQAELQHRQGQTLDAYPFGAIWFTYYPGLMIEWYPDVLVISTIQPTGIAQCRNTIEYYYPADIVAHQRGLIEAQQSAYRETAVEDEVICIKMQQGRHALYQTGQNQVGPYQSPLEDGMQHFHQFLREHIQLTGA
ncbi:MAG TPA: aromatic ring-hydroxylating dioxygenase subunit alpha [Halothiobacillus sp.]|nr:aromatic ring-hydroxylating dioxygenase subunit alpha [Halothiobacillus sp.]